MHERSYGVADFRQRLYWQSFKDIRVALPIRPEQERIVAALGDLTEELDQAQEHLNREIDLLGEYRTALISEVVTGKRDVRAIAAALPEAPPPADDPLDFDAGEDDLEEALMEEAVD